MLEDYSKIADMYQLVRSSYDRGVAIDKSMMHKTAELVQQHTLTGGIHAPARIHTLDANTLKQIAAGNQPDTVKVFNLLKAMHDLVEEKAAEQPYLISIGDKAEEIARSFEGRQQTTHETLQALEKLVAEVAEAERRKDEAGLTPDAFAVFWLLQRAEVGQAQDVARAVDEAFTAFPHWQTSSHQEQEVRKAIYKALIDAKVEGVIELATAILKMLRRATA